MESAELQRAIQIYLGADSSGRVYPIGMEERLRAEYGLRADLILDQVRKSLSILDEYEPDWSVDTLQSAAQKVEEDLARRLPNFSKFLFTERWRTTGPTAGDSEARVRRHAG